MTNPNQNSQNKVQKIFINAFEGCGKRKLDGKRLAEYFKINNHKLVNNPKDADVIILITCGASNYGALKAYKDIEHLKKFKGELIVAGCVPEIEPEEFKKHWTGKTFSTRDLEDCPEKIDKMFPGSKIKFKKIEDPNIPWRTIDTSIPKHAIKDQLIKSETTRKLYAGLYNHIFTNYFGEHYMHFGDLIKIPVKDVFQLRVSWGCSKKCSYCAIGRAIGKYRSKDFNTIMKEFKKGVKEGYTNIFLTSDDTGAYGKDFDMTFPELLREMIKIEGNYQLKLNSLNPVWIIKYIDELEKIFKSGKITSILAPIQSGNNRILKLMHRYSNRDKIIECFNRLKKAYPKLNISTQIIAGFPSETDEEFQQTLDLIKEADIDMGQIYPMSIRPNTPAVDIEPKVSEEDKLKRVRNAQKYLNKLGYKTLLYGGGLSFGGRRK